MNDSAVVRWLGIDDEPAAPAHRYHLARFLILRLLGLVYLVAFAILINQGLPLLGSHGLLPIDEFTAGVGERLGSPSAAFARLPSLFWYRFAPLGSDRVWDRELVGDWLPPLSIDDARLQRFLEAHGWLEAAAPGTGGT